MCVGLKVAKCIRPRQLIKIYSLKLLCRKGANRFLTVTKVDGSHTVRATAIFHLVRNSRHQIHTLVQRFPVTNKERQELLPRTDRSQASEGMLID